MNALWAALAPFAVFVVWLFFFGIRQRKDCPDCSKPLPALQSPFTKTKRQWVAGGYVCQNCGCETDKAGKKVGAGTASSRRSLIVSVGLLTLAAISALVLLFTLLHR
jgi:hypothetical protein